MSHNNNNTVNDGRNNEIDTDNVRLELIPIRNWSHSIEQRDIDKRDCSER